MFHPFSNTHRMQKILVLVLLLSLSLAPQRPGAAQSQVTHWKIIERLTQPTKTGPRDGFGYSVSIQGQLLAFSAPTANAGKGAIEVFTKDGNNFTFHPELTDPAGKVGDGFGFRTFGIGNTIFVSEPTADKFTGRLAAFSFTNNDWIFEPLPQPADAAQGDLFAWYFDPFGFNDPTHPTDFFGWFSAPGAAKDAGKLYIGHIILDGTPIQASYLPVTFSTPPLPGAFLGNTIVVDPNGNALVTETGTTFFNVGKAYDNWRYVRAPDHDQLVKDFAPDSGVKSIDVDSAPTPFNKTPPKQPPAWIGLMYDKSGDKSTEYFAANTGGPQVQVFASKDAGKTWMVNDTLNGPKGEKSFGAAGSACGDTLAILSNDPKKPTAQKLYFYALDSTGKLTPQDTLPGLDLMPYQTTHPEASDSIRFDTSCKDLYIGGYDPTSKEEVIGVFERDDLK